MSAVAVGRGAPGRKRVPRKLRERDMVEAASKVFGKRGYAGASMDEIAAAAGITKPMLYAYFGSKEGLFAACAKEAGVMLQERLREVGEVPGLRPDERLWRGILAVFDFVDEYSEGWALLYPDDSQPGGPIGAAGRSARDAMAALLASLFEEAAAREGIDRQATEHLEAMAIGFTATTIAMASAWIGSRESKELQAMRLMNLAWVGFGGMLEGRLWLPGQ